MAGPYSAPEGPFAQQGPSTDVETDKLRLTAAAFRRMLNATMINPGVTPIVGAAVAQEGAGTGRVAIAAGDVFVSGSSAVDQGMYHDYLSASFLDILTANPPHATNDRIDLVIARVRDTYYGDAENTLKLEAVTGTPAGSPVPPAAPASSLVLAQAKIRHAPGNNILAADLTDVRTLAGPKVGGVLLGTVTLGAGTVTFNIPMPTLWNTIRLFYRDCRSPQSGPDNVSLRFNGDTAANYYSTTLDISNNGTATTVNQSAAVGFLPWVCIASGTAMPSPFNGSGEFTLPGVNTATVKQIFGMSRYGHATTNQTSYRTGFWNGAAISSIGFLSNAGPGTNALSGFVDVYGYY